MSQKPSAPSFRSELRRGFNAYNLSVSAGAAAAMGAILLVFSYRGVAPDLFGHGRVFQATLFAITVFLFISVLHAGLHAYFGWRLSRGIQALARGNPRSAVRLLRVLDRFGMEHYDPSGLAHAALLEGRSRLQSSPESAIAGRT